MKPPKIGENWYREEVSKRDLLWRLISQERPTQLVKRKVPACSPRRDLSNGSLGFVLCSVYVAHKVSKDR